MGQTHTLAILLTILFHTLEQVKAATEFAALLHFGRFSRVIPQISEHAVRFCRPKSDLK